MSGKIEKKTPRRLSISELRRERAVALIFGLTYSVWLAILLLFTPFTNNLDEIKVTLLYFCGPLFVTLYLYFLRDKLLPMLPAPFLYPLLLYFLVMAISTLTSAYPWVGVFATGYQWALLGFYLGMFAAHRTTEAVEKGLYLITIFSFITTVFGLLHYVGLFTVIYTILWGDPDVVFPKTYLQNLIYTFLKSKEMFSTILNRDFYASLLVMLIPLTIAVILVTKEAKKLYLSIATLIMMFMCLFLALSKDSTAGMALTLIVFAILYKKYSHLSRVKIPFFTTGVIGLLIIFVTLAYLQSPSIIPKLKTVTVSIKSREIIWGGGMSIFYNFPFLGSGPGGFRVYFPQFRDPDHYLFDISNVTVFSHNRYIDLLCETGILGFIAYMAFIFVLLFCAYKQIKKCEDEKLKLFQIALVSGIIGILFTNFFSPNARWTVIGVCFWAVLGISTATYAIWDSKAYEIKEKFDAILKRIVLISLVAIGLLLIHKIYALIAIQKVFGLGLAFTIACLIFVPFFIIYTIQLLKKINNRFYYDSVTIFTLFVGIISAIFSILYFIGAYYNSQGLIYLQYNKYEPASAQFEKAIKYNPGFTTSYYKLAHSYHALGEVDKSLNTYLTLAKYQPDYAEIHYNLGVLYSETAQNKLDNGEQGAAIEDLKESVRHYEIAAKMASKAVVQSALAMAYIRSFELFEKIGREKELGEKYKHLAAQTLEKMLARPNPPVRSQYYQETVDVKKRSEPVLAQLYFVLKQYSKAETMYLKLWKQSPDNSNYQMRILECQKELKQDGETTVAFLKDALKYNPMNAKAHVMLSKVYLALGNDPESQRHMMIALKIDPTSATTKTAGEAPQQLPEIAE